MSPNEEKQRPLTSIIIVNHNGSQLVLDCIESIFKIKDQLFEVILVDSASSDNSQKKCKERFPLLKLIEKKENVGYCLGNNIGIKQAKGDFLVILNPDTKVELNWLDEFFSAYSKFGEGLYQAKLLTLNHPKVFNSAGNMMHIFGFGFSRDKGLIDNGQHDQIEQIGYSSGACLFISKKTMEKIGYFDPFLYVYHDDLDLGWRAAQLGIKSYYVPRSIVYHAGSYNYKWSPFKFYLLEKNRIYCLLTHYSKSTFYKMLPSLIVIEILLLLFYLYRGMFREKIRGYGTIIKNRKHIKKKFNELENKKTISDKELIRNFPNEIYITEEISKKSLTGIFNKIVSSLSRMTKRFIGV